MSDLALTGVAKRRVATTTPKRAARRRAWTADVLFGADAYDSLWADWQRLSALQEGPVLFQSPALLRTWAGHFADGRARSLATVVVRHEDRTILIWPLFVERRGIFRVASGAGAPIGQYDEVLLDPDYDAPAALAAALKILRRKVRPDLVSLERVRADSALRAALRDTQPICWEEGAPYADLSEGVGSFLATRKSRVLRQQKKRIRAFSRLGTPAFQLASEPDEAVAWLREALALKHEWLCATGRVSRAFTRHATADCLIDMARKHSGAGASPRMVIARLSLDGRTAAIEAGFRHGSTYHLYLGAFAPEFARLGPGNILTEHMIEWSVEHGVTRYDMLAPRSRNKGEWQTNEVAILDFALPMTMAGRAYSGLVMKRLTPALRNLFYALPPRARSFVAETALKM